MAPLQGRYSPLTTADRESDDPLCPETGSLGAKSNRRLRRLHVAMLYALIVALGLLIGAREHSFRSHAVAGDDPSLQNIYSPAEAAIEYRTVNFEGRFKTKNAYMGIPTEATDRIWSGLYDFGVSAISPEEAARLHNKTQQIPGRDDYVIMLDVFHQLHCLDELRKALYPERYGNWKWSDDGTIDYWTMEWHHWDHCIDALRQTLMCHADVTPLTFHENKIVHALESGLAVTHQCRDFGKIQEWARARQVPTGTTVDSDLDVARRT